MPYRRLPKTDKARIRSLQAVVGYAEQKGYGEWPFKSSTYSRVRSMLPVFSKAQAEYEACLKQERAEGQTYRQKVRMASMYLTHFVLVLKMTLQRGEIKSLQEGEYGVSFTDSKHIDWGNEEDLLLKGGKIIMAEETRMLNGGTPIYNPTIARVKVYYDIFSTGLQQQKVYRESTKRSLHKVTSMRADCDELILQLWNEIEAHFSEVLPVEKRLERCKECGMIFYLRKGEKKRMEKTP